MPLQLIPPPPDMWRECQRSLTDFLGANLGQEQTLYHLPVGTLGLEELAKGATLADRAPSGYRFFARWPDGRMITCEMSNPTPKGPAQFRSFAESELVATVFERISQALGAAPVQTADFELHFLSIPGINVEALHLICRGQGVDLVLTVLSEDARLAPNVVMEANAFLAQARAIAAARLALPTSSVLSS